MVSRTAAIAAQEDGLLSQWAFRNKLINGNFDLWRRGVTFASGYSAYGPDRWKIDTTNTTVTRGNAAAPYGVYCLLATPTAASNACTIAQPLEFQALIPLIGKKVAVSFFYNAQASQSFTAYLQKAATANNNTGGSGGWTTLASQTFAASTTVQRGILFADVPNDGTANGLRVVFTMSNAVSNVGLGLWGVQLEEGVVATPFEYRPLVVESTLAQSFYEVGTFGLEAYGAANNYMRYHVSYKTTKRVVPSVVIDSINYSSGLAAPSIVDSTEYGFSPRSLVTATGQQAYFGSYRAEAEI